MEHRHDRQDHVARRAVQRIGQGDREGVQHASSGGCTARPSGCRSCPTCSRATRPGSRRSSARSKRSLCGGDADPRSRAGSGSSLSAGMWARSVIATKVLIVFDALRDRLDQRQEGQVEEQRLVFGVVGDVDDLVRVQARVERVQHRARARHRVVELHVAMAVPGQRRDAVAALDAEAGKGVRHPARARRQLAVGRAVDVALDPARHHLLLAVVALGVDQQRRDQQRQLHHRTVHLVSSVWAALRGHAANDGIGGPRRSLSIARIRGGRAPRSRRPANGRSSRAPRSRRSR